VAETLGVVLDTLLVMGRTDESERRERFDRLYRCYGVDVLASRPRQLRLQPKWMGLAIGLVLLVLSPLVERVLRLDSVLTAVWLALAAVPLVALVGAMIKKPNRGEGQSIFHTYWGNGVKMIYADGRRVGPDDLLPGGITTVFPEGHVKAGDSPTLLIRLRPGQTVKARKGQDTFGWGDYIAYSQICTHAGFPASLYEQQTGRLLCPCHQSQFDVLQDAKPVFGPATRSLPKLPLGVEVVDGQQYFVAKGDFPEAIGPAFWERP